MRDKAGEAVIYSNLGEVYCLRGDFEKAVEYQEKNLKIVQKVGSRAQEGHAMAVLAASIVLSVTLNKPYITAIKSLTLQGR